MAGVFDARAEPEELSVLTSPDRALAGKDAHKKSEQVTSATMRSIRENDFWRAEENLCWDNISNPFLPEI
jgi:hypothetical protein